MSFHPRIHEWKKMSQRERKRGTIKPRKLIQKIPWSLRNGFFSFFFSERESSQLGFSGVAKGIFVARANNARRTGVARVSKRESATLKRGQLTVARRGLWALVPDESRGRTMNANRPRQRYIFSQRFCFARRSKRINVEPLLSPPTKSPRDLPFQTVVSASILWTELFFVLTGNWRNRVWWRELLGNYWGSRRKKKIF